MGARTYGVAIGAAVVVLTLGLGTGTGIGSLGSIDPHGPLLQLPSSNAGQLQPGSALPTPTAQPTNGFVVPAWVYSAITVLAAGVLLVLLGWFIWRVARQVQRGRLSKCVGKDARQAITTGNHDRQSRQAITTGAQHHAQRLDREREISGAEQDSARDNEAASTRARHVATATLRPSTWSGSSTECHRRLRIWPCWPACTGRRCSRGSRRTRLRVPLRSTASSTSPPS